MPAREYFSREGEIETPLLQGPGALINVELDDHANYCSYNNDPKQAFGGLSTKAGIGIDHGFPINRPLRRNKTT